MGLTNLQIGTSPVTNSFSSNTVWIVTLEWKIIELGFRDFVMAVHNFLENHTITSFSIIARATSWGWATSFGPCVKTFSFIYIWRGRGNLPIVRVDHKLDNLVPFPIFFSCRFRSKLNLVRQNFSFSILGPYLVNSVLLQLVSRMIIMRI